MYGYQSWQCSSSSFFLWSFDLKILSFHSPIAVKLLQSTHLLSLSTKSFSFSLSHTHTFTLKHALPYSLSSHLWLQLSESLLFRYSRGV
ncbi:hypothetical protein L6452_35571 [Arctium lappa]|uniref:Uncharacterized protein n=1 Tax=Arctium lappa TaxID=4217 RepID=A0ACB8Y668_ARCLA|nr:hypothetical protein L6452_35571 [Arctium lappa]